LECFLSLWLKKDEYHYNAMNDPLIISEAIPFCLPVLYSIYEPVCTKPSIPELRAYSQSSWE
jgi:hypothetical protein